MSDSNELFAGQRGRRLPGSPSIGIVGASGLVGEHILACLEERAFPVASLRLFASGRNSQATCSFGGEELPVEALSDGSSLADLDLVFLAATAALSRDLAPVLARAGVLVIDKSATWRTDPRVPLVVPEVNGGSLEEHAGLVASPNCTTIGLVLALAPLHRVVRLRRVHVTTLQAVSGAGRAGLQAWERELQAPELERGGALFPARIAGNVLPQCDALLESGATVEEEKLVRESRRLLSAADLDLQACCVRVPVAVGHGASVWLELEDELSPDAARELWGQAPAVRVLAGEELPTPLAVAGTDEVLIGRIRAGSNPREIWFFEVSDNLRRGAATNAVRIAEERLPLA